MRTRKILDLDDKIYIEFKDDKLGLNFDGGYLELNPQELYDWLGKEVLEKTPETHTSDVFKKALEAPKIAAAPNIKDTLPPSPWDKVQGGLEEFDLSGRLENVQKINTGVKKK